MRDLIRFLRARYTERRDEAHLIHSSRCRSAGASGECDCRIPQEVIADLNMKLALIDMHEEAAEQYSAHGPAWDHESEVGRARTATLRRVLRDLTRPFVDHPDHQGKEWAP
ncbi:DUF6221 family protein [Streptomyces sp. NPDC002853]